MIGPSLPPEFAAQRQTQRSPTPPTPSSESSSDEEVGPVPAPAGPSTTNSMDAAERAFRAKEERIAAARQAEDEAAKAPPKRDEWMLKLPSGPNLQSVIGDPLKLKNRGFSQSVGPAARVQSRSTLSSAGVTAEGAQAWTETPDERQARLQAEVAGEVLPLSEQGPDLGESAAMARERQRAQLLRENIKRHDPSRSKSLLEQHQERKEKESRSSKSRSSRHRHRRRSDSDSDEGRSRPDRHHRSHRSSRSSRHRSPDNKEEERSHRSSHHHRSHSHHSSRKQDRHRNRSTSPRPSTAKKPIAWDREAALGAGGKMLDDAAKAKKISDASGLSDRFAGSGSSFL